jgi:NitT/TauT family transport system substrate-binding protein
MTIRRPRFVITPVVLASLLAACSPAASPVPSASAPAPTASAPAPVGSAAAPSGSAPAPVGSAAAPSGSAQAPAGELTELQIVLPSPPEIRYYEFYVADKMGYFADEGLDVRLNNVGGSPFVMQSIAANTVPVGASTAEPAILGFPDNPAYQAVYQHDTKNTFDLLTPASSPYKTLKDLKGHSVGMADVVGGEALLLRMMMAREGLQPGQDIQTQALGFDLGAQLEALTSDRVQALVVAWNTQAAAEVQGVKLTCITCDERPEANQAIYANRDFLGSNQDTVVGVGRALAKAVVFAHANPEAAKAIIKEVVPQNFENQEFADVLMRITLENTAPPADGKIGSLDLKAWQNKMDDLLLPGAQSGLKAPIDLNELVNNSLVDQFNDFDEAAIEQEAKNYQG